MPKPSHRDKILHSGFTVFHEHGFHATSVQDIVDHAGVPKGSFYNHFKSKEVLGVEALTYYWDLNSKALAELEKNEMPALKRIDNHLAAFGESEFGCLVGNFSIELASSTAFSEHLSDLFQRWISALVPCIKDGQRDGTIRSDSSAKHLAELVVASLQGTIMKSKVDRDAAAIKRLRKLVQQILKS